MTNLEKIYQFITQSLEYSESSQFFLAESGNPFFSVDPGLVIWTWLVFFALLFVLYKFAWKPILANLDKREAKIKKSIDDAERIAQELAEAMAQKKSILSEANLEAKQIIDNGREQAEKIKVELEKKAKESAEEIILTAQKKIEQESQRAIEEVRVHVVEMAFAVAEKVIKDNLNNEKNNDLAKKYLEEIS